MRIGTEFFNTEETEVHGGHRGFTALIANDNQSVPIPRSLW